MDIQRVQKLAGIINELDDGLINALEVIAAAATDREDYARSDSHNRSLDTALQNKALVALDVYFNAARKNKEYAQNKWKEMIDQNPPEFPEVKMEKAKIEQSKQVRDAYIHFTEVVADLNRNAIKSESITNDDIDALLQVADALLDGQTLDTKFSVQTKTMQRNWVQTWNDVMPITVSKIADIRIVKSNAEKLLREKLDRIKMPIDAWVKMYGLGTVLADNKA